MTLIANGVIAVLKFRGFLLTKNTTMLSETYHSISDIGNTTMNVAADDDLYRRSIGKDR